MRLGIAVVLDGQVDRDTIGQGRGTVPVNLPSSSSVGDGAGLPLLLRVEEERGTVLSEAGGGSAGWDVHGVGNGEANGLGLIGVDEHALITVGRAVERGESESTSTTGDFNRTQVSQNSPGRNIFAVDTHEEGARRRCRT